MNADLQQLIALQRLNSAAQEAERRIAEEPDRQRALDARLEDARERVTSAKARLADNQKARRAIEKEVAVHQTRLSKFRDQLMSVKTNLEYQAMQKEIGFAQGEVKTLEDRILEQMLEGDDLAAIVKDADTQLMSEQKAIDADRRKMASELSELSASLEQMSKERSQVVSGLDSRVLATFEGIARRRNGIAVAEARDGICTICHVRLRPQVFNTVRRNEEIVQCDSCNRILYFVPGAHTPADATSV
jgi:predicted  nucleic acid-binding Zn-ribbon protein